MTNRKRKGEERGESEDRLQCEGRKGVRGEKRTGGSARGERLRSQLNRFSPLTAD